MTKHRIVVDEDPDVVEQIDRIARVEGVARADILRRAIRNLVFSVSSVPNIRNNHLSGRNNNDHPQP